MLIIFDLDGTLVNTIDDLGAACNHALASAGYPIHPIGAYPAMVGNGINKLIERALPDECKVGGDVDKYVMALRPEFVSYYDQHNCDKTHPYDGIDALLRYLHANGHTLAVASNKYQEATAKIVGKFWPNIFAVVFGERATVERKPNPQIVRDIVAKVGDGRILYVGDSLVDQQTARNAGVEFVACSWGFVPREVLAAANPDHLVDHPSQIAQIIENLYGYADRSSIAR